MLKANVNLSPMMAVRSGGVFPVTSIDLTRTSQGFPIMRFATPSKQNSSASAVPSVA
jgi:hypothetical protein